MANMKEIYNILSKLTPEEIDSVKSYLYNEKQLDKEEVLTDLRFFAGRVCPHCGSKSHVIRNGHRTSDGMQKYYCKDCHKSFVITTNTLMSNSHKGYDVWDKYINCMLQNKSLSESAKECNISYATSFYWRHKICDALSIMTKDEQLSGIVEADETFFPVSYKGNNKRMPEYRKPHHRGKEVKLRGVSHEQLCVPTCIDRTGRVFSKPSNTGKASTENISWAFANKIKKASTLVTDKAASYIKFAQENNLDHVQIKEKRIIGGIYHIQHINSYHSRLKSFIDKFRGVSSKYLGNYLAWENYINMPKQAYEEKKRTLLRDILTINIHERNKDIKERPIIPVMNALTA